MVWWFIARPKSYLLSDEKFLEAWQAFLWIWWKWFALLVTKKWNLAHYLYLFIHLALWEILVSRTEFLCIRSRLSTINLLMLSSVTVCFFSNMEPKNQQQKPGKVVETKATTFSTDWPCSVTADDWSQTWQPQNQSLQSVQVSIGIVLCPAAESPQKLSPATLTAV